MENRIKYRFDDFTLKNYKKLLKLAISQNYDFTSFNYDKVYSNKLIWRHDIEFSVDLALEMAKLEKELGVKANYFIQLHSPFYNTLEIKTFSKLKQIIALGHYIGLHFDAHFYQVVNKKALDYYVKHDKDWLEDLFQIEICSFSFHNNTKFTLSCEDDYYGGLINVYSKFFKQNYRYCSDSTGFWRYERLEDILKEKHPEKGLHVLTHDGMWQEKIRSPRQRIHHIIDSKAEEAKKGYDKRLKNFGGLNVDWEKVL